MNDDAEKRLYIERFHSIMRFLRHFHAPGNPPFELPRNAQPRHVPGSRASSKQSDHKAFATLLALQHSVVAVTSLTHSDGVELFAAVGTTAAHSEKGDPDSGQSTASSGGGTNSDPQDVAGARSRQNSYGSDSKADDPLVLLVAENTSKDSTIKLATLAELPNPAALTVAELFSFEYACDPEHRKLTLQAHGALLVRYLQNLGTTPESGAEAIPVGVRVACVQLYITNTLAPKLSRTATAAGTSLPLKKEFWGLRVKESCETPCGSLLQNLRFGGFFEMVRHSLRFPDTNVKEETLALAQDALQALRHPTEPGQDPTSVRVESSDPLIHISLATFYNVLKFTIVCYGLALSRMVAPQEGESPKVASQVAAWAGVILEGLVYSDSMRTLLQHSELATTFHGDRGQESSGHEGDPSDEDIYPAEVPVPEDLLDTGLAVRQKELLNWIRSLVTPLAALSRVTRSKLIRRIQKLKLRVITHPPPTQSLAHPRDLIEFLYPDAVARGRLYAVFLEQHRRAPQDVRWKALVPEKDRVAKQNAFVPDQDTAGKTKAAKSNWDISLTAIHCEAILALHAQTNAPAGQTKRMPIGVSKASCPACAALLCFVATDGPVDYPYSTHQVLSECSLPFDLPLRIHKAMVEHFGNYLKKVFASLTDYATQTPPGSSPSHSDDEEELRAQKTSGLTQAFDEDAVLLRSVG